jgi:hypothetical protein
MTFLSLPTGQIMTIYLGLKYLYNLLVCLICCRYLPYTSGAVSHINRCSDQSVAVRKQAVSTLSSLLQARPMDTAIQEAWIDAALPLVLDVESTIQAKVCQAVCDIIIVGATAPLDSPENQAVWAICGKIGDVGCSKLLKSAVSALRRLGIFKSMAEKSSGPKMKAVLSAIKTACCVTLTGETPCIRIIHP